MPSVSVVIRTYNEASKLRRLLVFLQQDEVEIVVVDNGSTDETSTLLKEFGVKSVWLDQKEFNYPKSINLGVAKATGDIIVLLSGHSVPVHREWLASVTRHFEDTQVAGVYGPLIWEEDSPLFEKMSGFPFMVKSRLRKVSRVGKDRLGIMGATNCAFRRSLWEVHQFDEAYGAGGEDGEWGRWALSKGYAIVFDAHFLVRHSHYLTFKKMIKQQVLWRSLRGPREFDPADLSFRDDIKR